MNAIAMEKMPGFRYFTGATGIFAFASFFCAARASLSFLLPSIDDWSGGVLLRCHGTVSSSSSFATAPAGTTCLVRAAISASIVFGHFRRSSGHLLRDRFLLVLWMMSTYTVGESTMKTTAEIMRCKCSTPQPVSRTSST